MRGTCWHCWAPRLPITATLSQMLQLILGTPPTYNSNRYVEQCYTATKRNSLRDFPLLYSVQCTVYFPVLHTLKVKLSSLLQIRPFRLLLALVTLSVSEQYQTWLLVVPPPSLSPSYLPLSVSKQAQLIAILSPLKFTNLPKT